MNREHPFRTLVKLVGAGQYPSVMLLHGHEDFLVNWAADYLREKMINHAVQALDYSVFYEEMQLDDIIAACETLPVFSPKRLVYLKNTDILSSNPQDMGSAELERMLEYMDDIPESCMLLMSCENPNRNGRLYRRILKTGIAYDFTPLDRSTLASWIANQLKSMDRTAAPSAIMQYIDACGYCGRDSEYTLYNVKNDLAKAAAFAEKKEIGVDDFLSCMQGDEEKNAFAILDAAFSGKKSTALSILHSSVSAEPASKSDGAVLSFLGLLCSQLEVMLEAEERGGLRAGEGVLAKSMGQNPYRIKKALEASRGRSVEELRRILSEAYSIEQDYKAGRLEAYTGLELFIAAL